MLESLGLDISPRAASLWLGLLIGLAFGALAEVSRFCLRRAVAGPVAERKGAGAMWLAALATAIAGTQLAQHAGLLDLSGHRFLAADVPALAIVLGGLMFGIGMVLARGCAARLTVLAATGNLRAASVVVLIAIAALITLKGLLAPLATALAGITLPLPALAALPGAAIAIPLALAALAIAARPGALTLAYGVAIGALVPLAWLGTGWLLLDDFDPVPVEALSFIGPVADTLFWSVAATAIAPGFGVGLVLGTLGGGALSALIGRRTAWQSFHSPRETGRYALGGALMGVGGVLAGGCTIGAGLTGVAALSSAALLALVAIIAGARAADRLLSASSAGSAGSAATQAPQPAR